MMLGHSDVLSTRVPMSKAHVFRELLSYTVIMHDLLNMREIEEFGIICVMNCPTFVRTLRKQMCYSA